MKRPFAVLTCLFAMSGLAAADTDTAPFASMRTLQVLQEQIAHGNGPAQAAQPKLMDHIADGFLAADPAVWREPRNARAAILFLLSGGKPSVIRTVMERATFPAEGDRLLKGALAYGEGQDEVARALLEPIEIQSLPTALGSHVALVKATLLAEGNAAKAIALLDQARLLAPGTLIEEAALRREVFLLIDAGGIDKAMLLARQYVRRFRSSSYADNFKQRFAAAAAAMAAAGDTVKLARLDTVLNELPAAETRGFYLALAQSSILGGRTAAARFAADKVLAVAGQNAAAIAKAKLYRAAALVVSDDSTEGMAALDGVDPGGLSADDRSLREAAVAIGKAIQFSGPVTSPTADPGLPSGDPVQTTIERARNALAESDRLLAVKTP